MLKAGDKWNDWTVDELLGQGRFGKVFRISRTEFGHVYESALKVIRIPQNEAEYRNALAEGMDDDTAKDYYESLVEDIVSECALMNDLKGNSYIASYEGHEVVKLEDAFGWEINIRMELLTPLMEYLKETDITETAVVGIGKDICRALEACERNNIIHRDIKPENVFYSKQGTFKLGDFGIARELEGATAGMSRKGTSSYMAPEVFNGQPYNASVDTYSLGILLYWLANNYRTPFMPKYPEKIKFSDKETAYLRRMRGEKLPPPDNASEELSSVILKACSFDPKERYASAAEMLAALESVNCQSTSISPQPAAVEAADPDATYIEDNTVTHTGIEPIRFNHTVPTDTPVIVDELSSDTVDELSSNTVDEPSSNTVDELSSNEEASVKEGLKWLVAALIAALMMAIFISVWGEDDISKERESREQSEREAEQALSEERLAEADTLSYTAYSHEGLSMEVPEEWFEEISQDWAGKDHDLYRYYDGLSSIIVSIQRVGVDDEVARSAYVSGAEATREELAEEVLESETQTLVDTGMTDLSGAAAYWYKVDTEDRSQILMGDVERQRTITYIIPIDESGQLTEVSFVYDLDKEGSFQDLIDHIVHSIII